MVSRKQRAEEPIMLSDILDAMQFNHMRDKDPLNTTGAAKATITFQYATTSQPGDLPTGSTFSGWTAFTAAEKTAMKTQLAHIETLLNVDFVEVTGAADPDLNLGKVTIPGSTAGFGGNSIGFSGTTITEWDGFAIFDNTIDVSQPGQENLLLHELAHAMGLKHPFTGITLPAATDNNKFTVMSYTDNPDNGEPSDALMLYDVFALQDIWGGAGNSNGNTTYTGSRTDTVDAIWDTGGTDRFDASARSNSVKLDLREGKFSKFGSYDDVAVTFGTTIENATGGSGNDTIRGNNVKNTLNGKAGKDTILGGGKGDNIFGGTGADDLKGQGGKDRLNGGKGGDSLTGGKGIDTFIIAKNGGKDVITDFRDDVDAVRFKKLGTVSEILAQATDVGGDAVFDFGGGNVLTVLDTTVAQISDDILA